MPFSASREPVGAGGGGLLPPGKHKVVIDTCEFDKTNKPCFVINYRGKFGSIRDWVYLTEAAQGRVNRLAQVAGVLEAGEDGLLPPYDINDTEGYLSVKDSSTNKVVRHIEPVDFVGREFVIEVTRQESQSGASRLRVGYQRMWAVGEMDEEVYAEEEASEERV